jgi:CHAD domain-containing protein
VRARLTSRSLGSWAWRRVVVTVGRAAADPNARRAAAAALASAAAVAAGRVARHRRAARRQVDRAWGDEEHAPSGAERAPSGRERAPVGAHGSGDRSDGSGKGGSRAYRLNNRESLPRGIRRIARGRIDHALDELGGRTERDRDEAVHEARKDMKKLRAVLRLVRDELGDGLYPPENQRFRDAGRRLSSTRDAQVMLESLEWLTERFEDELPDDGFGGLRRELEARYRSLVEDGRSGEAAMAEAAAEIEAGRDRIEDWPLHDDWPTVSGGLRRVYARGRKRFADVRDEPTVENLHEWRKRVKDLWYHLLILQRCWPDVMEPLAEQAHELSERLGKDHDLAVLRTTAQESADPFADRADPERLAGLIDRARAELQEGAVALGHRLYAERPRAFSERIESYWAAWRDGHAAG